MRRRKEDAAQTRATIIDAALACFDRHGIAHSTLDQIAAGAGVTKGAIYWHFAGKRELLRAIREQIALPILDQADTSLLHAGAAPALARIERFLLDILSTLETDRRRRVALSVMQFKCEYVGGLDAELAGMLRNAERLGVALESAYRQARRARQLVHGLSPRIAAVETLMFLGGLVRLWLLDRSRKGFRNNARPAIRAHVRSRQAP